MVGWLRYPRTDPLCRERRGGYAVWNMCLGVMFLSVGSMTADLTSAYRHRTILQATVDASAAAAAAELPDEIRATAMAMTIANRDADAAHGAAMPVTASDIEFGVWDPTKSGEARFVANATPANAIRVRMSNDAAYGDITLTSLLSLLGFRSFAPEVQAIATAVDRSVGAAISGPLSVARLEAEPRERRPR